MSMLFGMLFALPSIEIQALFGCVVYLAHSYFGFDVNMTNSAVMIIFFWWIRDARIISQRLFSHLLDDLKPNKMAHLPDDGRYRRTHPPWPDAAPYLPFGGCYGYAMSHYRIKKKSGHANPKHGGECEPITSCSMTHWLAHTPFWIALCYAVIFVTTSISSIGMDACSNIFGNSKDLSTGGISGVDFRPLSLQIKSRLSGPLDQLQSLRPAIPCCIRPWFLGRDDGCTGLFYL